jgi:hypothetical protein
VPNIIILFSLYLYLIIILFLIKVNKFLIEFVICSSILILYFFDLTQIKKPQSTSPKQIIILSGFLFFLIFQKKY